MVRHPKPAMLGLTAAGLIGMLAGCSAPGGTYADGEYTADGSYSAPSGTETITVDLTLEDGVVTELTVTPHATEGNQAKFQQQFAQGVPGEVLGKPLDEISVARVAGSSLTSGGFTKALADIKAQALEH